MVSYIHFQKDFLWIRFHSSSLFLWPVLVRFSICLPLSLHVVHKFHFISRSARVRMHIFHSSIVLRGYWIIINTMDFTSGVEASFLRVESPRCCRIRFILFLAIKVNAEECLKATCQYIFFTGIIFRHWKSYKIIIISNIKKPVTKATIEWDCCSIVSVAVNPTLNVKNMQKELIAIHYQINQNFKDYIFKTAIYLAIELRIFYCPIM